jgi:hypothetical protein
MKTWIISSLASALLVGCATNDTDRASRNDGAGTRGLDDQPQSVTAGEGSLMPGAYGSRPLPTGQFTGQERTMTQIGQGPTLPREADARELARNEEGLATGAGTLGQSGISPNRPVSAESLIESSAGSSSQAESEAGTPAQGIGAPPLNSQGGSSSTNVIVSPQRSRPE